MDAKYIIWPVLVQVGLTLFMYVRLATTKAAAIKDGEVDQARRALHQDAWPESVLKVSNNIGNQFETPVLFYVLVMLLLAMAAVDTAAVVVAWVFVGSRLIHAYIHTGSNIVPWRLRVFLIGMASLFGLLGLAIRAVIAL